MKRSAFTLVELIVSIVILSILMLFLYKSYASLNRSNRVFSQEVKEIARVEKIKKALYLDLTTAKEKSVKIYNQSRDIDVFYMQSGYSLHKRVNPYVAYVVKDKKLYRLESLRAFQEYPFGADSQFIVEYLGDVKIFRLYKSKVKSEEVYLLHLLFEGKEKILLKVKVFGGGV